MQFARIAQAMTSVALVLFVLAEFDSPALAGIVAAVSILPGLLISPWADRDLDIDHRTLSFDAYLRLIEDRFLGGQRLDGENQGRPDPRPTVREEVDILGDLARAFDFSQEPIPPLMLDPWPDGKP